MNGERIVLSKRNQVRIYYASLIASLVLMVALFVVLWCLYGNGPIFSGPSVQPLFIVLVAVAAVFLGIMLLFGKKTMKIAIELDREKLLSRSVPYLQSAGPLGDGEALIRRIASEMKDGRFKIAENVDLHPDARTTLAYRVRFTFSKDYLGDYVFLIRCPRDAIYGVDYPKAGSIIEALPKKRLLRQSIGVALCVFVDTVDPELAGDVMNFFSRELRYIMAAYDLSTGRVYFMNGKSSGRLAKLQELIRKYIVGES